MDTKAKFPFVDDLQASDPAAYSRIVAVLQYLRITRPELAYVVLQIYMHGTASGVVQYLRIAGTFFYRLDVYHFHPWQFNTWSVDTYNPDAWQGTGGVQMSSWAEALDATGGATVRSNRSIRWSGTSAASNKETNKKEINNQLGYHPSRARTMDSSGKWSFVSRTCSYLSRWPFSLASLRKNMDLTTAHDVSHSCEFLHLFEFFSHLILIFLCNCNLLSLVCWCHQHMSVVEYEAFTAWGRCCGICKQKILLPRAMVGDLLLSVVYMYQAFHEQCLKLVLALFWWGLSKTLARVDNS